MKQQNQFRSQNGSIYSTSASKKEDVVKFDTLKRELDNQTSDDAVGVLHASVMHANKSLSKV